MGQKINKAFEFNSFRRQRHLAPLWEPVSFIYFRKYSHILYGSRKRAF
jgi:hypothetical protein